jgi:hypothetical protein
MKELPKNALDKKLWVFRKILTRIPMETGELKRGVTGMLPLRCLPLWGSEGVTLIFSDNFFFCTAKKSDEFLHPDRIKNNAFFLSCFFKPPAFRKTIVCMEANTPFFQAQDAGKDNRNPLFFPLRNYHSGITNEYGNIHEKKS